MPANKTVQNDGDVEKFLQSVPNEKRRNDARHLMARMEAITGQPPKMWGASLIGFDTYHYKYDSGHEGDFFMTGLSPRKTALTVYVMPGFDDFEDELARLGPHKLGKSCLYLSSLDKVDQDVLEEIIAKSYKFMKDRYKSA